MNPNNKNNTAHYWNQLADRYQSENRISTRDYHYGPLLPGDKELNLLPIPLKGLRCLEVGCGAGQNSIYLAGEGATCVALDISENQLDHGQKLASERAISVEFKRQSMEDMDPGDLGDFDLIHSTYALPFSTDPGSLINTFSLMLKPGGTLLLTTGHPLYGGAWVELDEGEEGIFLQNYFNIPPDLSMADDEESIAQSKTYPLSTMTDWIIRSDLVIDAMIEPQPLPIPDMKEEEIQQRVPYWSQSWRALYPQLSKIPVVVIFKCRKPEN